MLQNSAPCSPGPVMRGRWWYRWPEPWFAQKIWHTALLKATEAQKAQVSNLVWLPPCQVEGMPTSHASVPLPYCYVQTTVPDPAAAGNSSICSSSFPQSTQVLQIIKGMSLVHRPSGFKVHPSSGQGCPPAYSPGWDVSRRASTGSSHQPPQQASRPPEISPHAIGASKDP